MAVCDVASNPPNPPWLCSKWVKEVDGVGQEEGPGVSSPLVRAKGVGTKAPAPWVLGPKEPQGSALGEVGRMGVSPILSELSSRS